jgi:nucleoside-diphosphate-sugar epimerase
LELLLPDFDIVFHLAAQTSTYFADSDPASDISINLLPLVNILDVCERKSLCPVIIFSGTATEVGMNKRWPVNENFKNKPVTIYDLNKLLAETYLNYYCRKGIVKGTTLRLANVYGPGPANSSKDRGMVNLMIRKAIDKLPLTLYGTGKFIRDYIYIDDVVKAFCSAAVNIDKLNGGFFYIGSGTGHSLSDLFNTIISECYERTGFRPEIKHTEFPEKLSVIEKRQFVANIDKFVENTNWLPETDLAKGIGLTIDYFRKSR